MKKMKFYRRNKFVQIIRVRLEISKDKMKKCNFTKRNKLIQPACPHCAFPKRFSGSPLCKAHDLHGKWRPETGQWSPPSLQITNVRQLWYHYSQNDKISLRIHTCASVMTCKREKYLVKLQFLTACHENRGPSVLSHSALCLKCWWHEVKNYNSRKQCSIIVMTEAYRRPDENNDINTDVHPEQHLRAAVRQRWKRNNYSNN